MRKAIAQAVLFLSVLAGLLITGSLHAEARCVRTGDYRLTSKGPWPITFWVPSGEDCTDEFIAGSRSMFKRLILVSAPKHGSITLREGGHYRYKTPPGYRGLDAFTLRVCGIEAGGYAGCADLQYSVNIQ
jgi:hypothetical protein